MLRLWSSLLKGFHNNETNNKDKEENVFSNLAALEKKQVVQIIDSCFVFAACWSLCITVNTQYRRLYDTFFKKVCNGEIEGLLKFNNRKILPEIMSKGTIYDYCYIPEMNTWKAWLSFRDNDAIDKFPKDAKPQDIVVTTIDTIRYSYI